MQFIGIKLLARKTLFASFGALLLSGLILQPAYSASTDTSAVLDSLEARLPSIEKKVLSTLFFGGSAPVSFSGEARLKLQYHNFDLQPDFMRDDRSWLQANWEGNESLLRLGMVVRAGRNTVLWSRIGFQHTLPGSYLNDWSGDTLTTSRHDKMNLSSNIHEDMSAGIALRTVPASFWLKMGNVHWIEASPFTIWKSQPRTFAWEYLPFEIEQPITRYFEYNIARGEKTGRAAWNKKAFNGINLESIDLPFGLYLNFLYGTFERYDNFEREYIDFSNDLAYADVNDRDVKGRGIGDTYRHVVHLRAAKEKLLADLTLGVNFVALDYSEDIIRNNLYKKVFGFRDTSGYSFYKEPKVYSLDLRGAVNDHLEMHADIGLSHTDTAWFEYTPGGREKEMNSGISGPALFLSARQEYTLPVELDFAYIPPGFYSPFSFAMPVDAFYPFGANLTGAGKFLARSEASPYAQNMVGAKVMIEPVLKGYGHLRIIYGQHKQLESSRDLLYFPYRLNGADLFSLFHTSYNRWGNGLVDGSMNGSYRKRLGDESYKRVGIRIPFEHPEHGGLRSDYLSMYEGFAAYENAAQADSNVSEVTGIMQQSAFVPRHTKWTFNLELDAAYDIGGIIGYKRDLFLSGYAALNGISTAFKPLFVNDDDEEALLWGTLLRFEPAIALTKNFYLLGLAGFENWRSQQAYLLDEANKAVAAPIDYRDYAVGLGFDWDMLSRVGLHGRFKWMKHEDTNVTDNSWSTPIASLETKMWF
ncbi:MAG: hypothetical protein GF398_00210 [Chitinivibrionales bacterium]|nr:hypothetical protein [Chitinivibrionales bacterium]